jgi:hypothetical protein
MHELAAAIPMGRLVRPDEAHGITANLVAPSTVAGPKATELITAEWPRQWRSWQVRSRVSPPAITFPVNGGLVME